MNSFIVSVLAQSCRPAGQASALRVESTPHGGPQRVLETTWQTDTGPSDPRSEDRGTEKTAEIAHPGGAAQGTLRYDPIGTNGPQSIRAFPRENTRIGAADMPCHRNLLDLLLARFRFSPQ